MLCQNHPVGPRLTSLPSVLKCGVPGLIQQPPRSPSVNIPLCCKWPAAVIPPRLAVLWRVPLALLSHCAENQKLQTLAFSTLQVLYVCVGVLCVIQVHPYMVWLQDSVLAAREAKGAFRGLVMLLSLDGE